MNPKTTLLIKIFIGLPLTGDVQLLMKGTNRWKDTLEEIRYEGKSYLGTYLEKDSASVKDLKEQEEKIMDRLHKIWPKHIFTQKLVVFPQIFIP